MSQLFLALYSQILGSDNVETSLGTTRILAILSTLLHPTTWHDTPRSPVSGLPKFLSDTWCISKGELAHLLLDITGYRMILWLLWRGGGFFQRILLNPLFLVWRHVPDSTGRSRTSIGVAISLALLLHWFSGICLCKQTYKEFCLFLTNCNINRSLYGQIFIIFLILWEYF